MRAPRLFSRLKGLAHPRSYVVTRLTRFEGGSFFPFLVAYLVSYRAFRVKILTSVVKKKKNLIIQMYPCPNVLRNKCLVRNIQLAWNLRARRIKWNVRRYLWDIWRWDVRDNRDFHRVTCFPKDRRISKRLSDLEIIKTGKIINSWKLQGWCSLCQEFTGR